MWLWWVGRRSAILIVRVGICATLCRLDNAHVHLHSTRSGISINSILTKIPFPQVVPDCVGPSRRRTYDKIEATPFHLPSPTCSEPAKVVEETEEVDSDYGSLPSQELEYEEQGSVSNYARDPRIQ